jgi:hypothetical protein|tara:strand:- start:5306 stop:5485 length:180 start_codon:yes stop_codon:yes gene_type:complete
MTAETARTRIDQHEEICALRYKNIEARLDSGSKRFVRLESMIWGLYVLIIGSQVIGALL